MKKKGDLILVLVILIAAAGWLAKGWIWPQQAVEKQALIKVEGELYTTHPLEMNNEQQEIPVLLPGNNFVYIVSEKDQIWVTDASCPDKVCINTGRINKLGQSIVCLPNKTVIYIEGTEKPDIDEIAF